MAYRGYLVKVGDYIIPNSIIQANSYKPSLKGQDLDSYRDLDGKLHREALANFAPKVEFNTRPMLTNNEVTNLFNNIRRNYTNEREKKANVEVYMPEKDLYVTNEMYMPDVELTIRQATDTEVVYDAFRIAFISYGVEV